MIETPRQLSDGERAELKERLSTNVFQSRTLGFKIRGEGMKPGALVTCIPRSLSDEEVSVCGVKGFLIDEVREFFVNGSTEIVDCAAVAALEIVDSPVHVHAYTREMYEILAGNGKMILGETVVDVAEGNVIVIPSGVEHGLCSRDPEQPVRVLLSFMPGIAPKSKPAYRDEALLYGRTSERIAAIQTAVQKEVREL